MRRRLPIPLACGLVAAGLLGCSVRTADLTVVTSRDVAFDATDIDGLPSTKVVGTDTSYSVLLVPLGISRLDRAVEAALAKADADLLVDAKVYEAGWFLPLLPAWKPGFPFGVWTIEVEGKAVKLGRTPR